MNMFKNFFLFIILVIVCLHIEAQSNYQMTGNKDVIDANFLSSYYHQDGNNSAVQGGLGEERLFDIANVLIVNVPLDSVRSISTTLGADYYSSASTDRIDAKVSSASVKDVRFYGSLGYEKKNLDKGQTYSIGIGGSIEYDYASFHGSLGYSKEWNQGNTEWGIKAQAFIDQWQAIYPEEIRRDVRLDSKGRQSFNISSVFSQVINQKTQISLVGDIIYMRGLLSTPFHRVYFSDLETPDIERLPDSRLKFPISIRINHFLNDRMIIRSWYRYYWDDFGIQGHTANIEIPIIVSESIRLSPSYRYHTQSGADYFAAFKTHLSSEEFYTSDYDLSELNSHMVGMGVGYFPAFGISQKSIFSRDFTFKSIEAKFSYYRRSTGLNAYIGSINFQFQW
jgi:hypothetical protein